MEDRNRYCTPRLILDPVYAMWGRIDLDPCWDPTSIVRALRTFDIRRGQDALKLRWRGRVFLNPPYSGPAPFLRRAAIHYRRGLAETLAIVNVMAGSRYWHQWVWPHATAICFLDGRVAFLVNGKPKKGTRFYDQAVIYYGDDVRRFRQIWSRLGVVVDTPGTLTRGIRGAKVRSMQHDDDENMISAPGLAQLVAPALAIGLYRRISHYTIADLVDMAVPILDDFLAGYHAASAARMASEEEDEDETGANGRDHDSPLYSHDDPTPPTPRKRAKKKAAKKKAPKKSAAKKPATATGGSTTAKLDERVLGILRERATWVASRELMPVIAGANDNQVRKSLARLVERGKIQSQGKTKSKVYIALPA